MENDVLFVICTDPLSGAEYTIGKITRSDQFSFEYCDECKEAEKVGWFMIPSFPEYKKYYSEKLFPAFACRMPDKKRRDINQILKKYGLTEFDQYELLKNSGGKLPIDFYSFKVQADNSTVCGLRPSA